MTSEYKQNLIEADQSLALIIHQIPEPLVNSTYNVFHDLMSCILEQQIHYRSTKKIFEKMLKSVYIDRLTVQNFPQFEDKAFSSVKLSLAKYETVLAVVSFFNENNLPWHTLSNQEVRKQLSAIKGVGSWTMDMILLYTLERPDIFPADDFHLKQIMTKIYGLSSTPKLKAQMLEIASHWNEHTSLAVKYLLCWKQYLKQRK
jgi:DNA-3-methyladenine glycosylase II